MDGIGHEPSQWHYWSHDERYYYFINPDSNTVKRVRISDHKVELVMKLNDVGRVGWGNYGAWFGLTPDDSPLTLRDVGTHRHLCSRLGSAVKVTVRRCLR